MKIAREIGHWVSAEVLLHNPSREKLVLEPHVESAKSGCFALHYAPGARDVDLSRSDAESEELTFATARVPKTLLLPPRSSLALLLLFRPGAFGFAGQKATVTFRSSNAVLQTTAATYSSPYACANSELPSSFCDCSLLFTNAIQTTR